MYRIVSYLILLCCMGAHAHESQHSHYVGHHGMVLFQSENDSWYASHLPLHVAPHDFQLIYEVELSDTHLIKQGAASKQMTILPERFDLAKLIAGDIFTLDAVLYLGHFERGGKVFGRVTVSFKKLVYKRQVVNQAPSGLKFDLITLSSGATLAIHQIASKPSFDALTWVSQSREGPVSCEPSQLTTSVTRQIEQCLNATPFYLETKDFQ